MDSVRNRSPNVTTLVRICGNVFSVRWRDGRVVIRKLRPAKRDVVGPERSVDCRRRAAHLLADGGNADTGDVESADSGVVKGWAAATSPPSHLTGLRKELPHSLASDPVLFADCLERPALLVQGNYAGLA